MDLIRGLNCEVIHGDWWLYAVGELVAKFVFVLFEINYYPVIEKNSKFLIIRMWIFIYIRDIVFEKQAMISATFFSFNNWSIYLEFFEYFMCNDFLN